MSSSHTRRLEPCTYEGCASRRFHVGDDGYTYCERGHQQSERGAVIAEDTGEFIVHGAKSKRHDSDAESTSSRASTFSGSRALEHYLLCAQLVLRKQLQWLIEVQKLPEELEALVRDLWALRLEKLHSRIAYDSESDTDAASSQALFSSQSESETDNASSRSRRSQRREAQVGASAPNLIGTIALCYIGLLLLRIPLTAADLCGWVDDGQLLYYRAHREVPAAMQSRLPGEYERLLEPQDLLRPEKLHRQVESLLRMLRDECGMAIPQINASLVLFRWVKTLALPLEMFVATRRLAGLLEMDFAFDAVYSHVTLRYPEVRLVALLTVATKLFLPFDGIYQHSQRESYLSMLSMDWEKWSKMHGDDGRAAASSSPLTFGEAFSFTETDCLEASDEKLDAYLTWCADNIASDDVREKGPGERTADFRRALFAMFPLYPAPAAGAPEGPTVPTNDDQTDRKLQQILRAVGYRSKGESSDANAESRQPGSSYRRFRREADLPEHAMLFYPKAAKLAAVSVDTLVQAVFLVERRLQTYEEGQRNAAKHRSRDEDVA